MASFQAKIGWKRMKKRKKKFVVPFRSLPTGRVIENSKKRKRKFKKNEKIPLQLHFKQKQDGKGREIEKIKNIVPFRSHPTRNRKFQ